MAIPGRTGRQCKEFYESLVAQGKVIDDRYVIEVLEIPETCHYETELPDFC